MSGVKRYYAEVLRPYRGEMSLGTAVILASDYDRLELECADLRASLDGYKNCMRLMVEESTCADWSGENDESIFATAQTWCGKYQHANQERDALRAQVEVMRALLGECRDLTDPRQWPLRLHDKINSAMQDKP